MGISLFSHNEQAYVAAAAMLDESGKTAVIHPTGTGKSFIAFKLCEDHPDAKICWLSPSEQIYLTQRENLQAAGAKAPENICFFTYAKLCLLGKAEIEAIRPNYIILDEFHRCGAEFWGEGVKRLLKMFPNAPILGLSATNIRYLDGQRDMAMELFDGNVASEMTLGEAIALGILAAPKYVVSIYSCQKELEKYQSRVRRTKNRAVRDAAQKYLDALRRSVSMAAGLDDIFARHMSECTGKYIVFCANAEHMDEMIRKVPEWFCKVDREAHIYRAYSNDPLTSRAFSAFKEDKSPHLKLLFCIDMLNEGIHVDDISGVILFRPTISPIVYKQQIGRALSAGGRREPLILDIVNNFENLYSIGTIQEELEDALSYYRGEYGEEIVRERFDIVDEVRDCRELFDALNDTLTASWELMYEEAAAYYREHGNLDVPRRYKTKQGYSLGSWLLTQRRVRAGQVYGRLSPGRIAKLDAIGMVWEKRSDYLWSHYMAAAAEYRAEYGDLAVPARYVSPNGQRLGRWISNLRFLKENGRLAQQRIDQLNALGMVWGQHDLQWEKNYRACAQYYAEHGNLDIPTKYVSPEGLRVGEWLRRQRALRKNAGALSVEQIERLDAIGMDWLDCFERAWEIGFAHAEQYRKEHGDLDVPATYVCEDGFVLGKWLGRHKKVNGRSGIRLTPERCERLKALGFRFGEEEDPWMVRYRLARAYYEKHGDLDIPADYVEDGIWLHKWLNEQRHIAAGRRGEKRLTGEQLRLLRAISFDGETRRGRNWEAQYEEARSFYRKNGHLAVPDGYVGTNQKRLDVWVRNQRRAIRMGKLDGESRQRLREIGLQ